jgi:single-strand DNA-binding protein
MPSFNKVILVGNLTADPELKQTPSGVSVCRFSIAVQRRFGRNEQGQTTADFFNIVAWRQSAEFVARYFTKGRAILVCGQIQNDNWTDQQGVKHYSTSIVADEVTFADSKSGDSAAAGGNAAGGNQYTPNAYGSPAYNSSENNNFEEITSDDNLPF